MLQGQIKWFNSKKGYGFIRPQPEGKDVFLHISALERSGIRSIADGENVSYDIIVERGRPAADNIRIIR